MHVDVTAEFQTDAAEGFIDDYLNRWRQAHGPTREIPRSARWLLGRLARTLIPAPTITKGNTHADIT